MSYTSVVDMAISFRVIFWIPVAIFLILNMIFKLWIFLLQHIGNASVWVNRQFISAGNYFTTKAEDDDKVDDFINKIQNLNIKAKQRRGRK